MCEREREMTTDERAGRERMNTTVLEEIKSAKKGRLPQHTERKLLLWQGKENRNLRWEEKKEDGIKNKKIVRDRQSMADRKSVV